MDNDGEISAEEFGTCGTEAADDGVRVQVEEHRKRAETLRRAVGRQREMEKELAELQAKRQENAIQRKKAVEQLHCSRQELRQKRQRLAPEAAQGIHDGLTPEGRAAAAEATAAALATGQAALAAAAAGRACP